MRTLFVTTLCIAAVLFAGAAPAECVSENPEKAVEQMLFFRMLLDADLDSYTMSEMLDGYAMYEENMSSLAEDRAALKKELQKMIDEDAGGYAIGQKVEALMDLDQQIFDAKMAGCREAGTVLDGALYAKLYLLVSELDKNIAKTKDILAGKGVCPLAAAGICPMAAAAPCAAGPAASPEELIMEGVKLFTTKITEQDVKGLMAAFADDFEHYEYGDKEGLQMFLEQAADMGYLEGLEVSLEDAEVKIDGDEASVYPIDAMGAFGTITLEFILGKKDGEWKITSMDAAGM
jgi:hypothetical protein